MAFFFSSGLEVASLYRYLLTENFVECGVGHGRLKSPSEEQSHQQEDRSLKQHSFHQMFKSGKSVSVLVNVSPILPLSSYLQGQLSRMFCREWLIMRSTGPLTQS
jgi:hypothetical protein